MTLTQFLAIFAILFLIDRSLCEYSEGRQKRSKKRSGRRPSKSSTPKANLAKYAENFNIPVCNIIQEIYSPEGKALVVDKSRKSLYHPKCMETWLSMAPKRIKNSKIDSTQFYDKQSSIHIKKENSQITSGDRNNEVQSKNEDATGAWGAPPLPPRDESTEINRGQLTKKGEKHHAINKISVERQHILNSIEKKKTGDTNEVEEKMERKDRRKGDMGGEGRQKGRERRGGDGREGRSRSKIGGRGRKNDKENEESLSSSNERERRRLSSNDNKVKPLDNPLWTVTEIKDFIRKIYEGIPARLVEPDPSSSKGHNRCKKDKDDVVFSFHSFDLRIQNFPDFAEKFYRFWSLLLWQKEAMNLQSESCIHEYSIGFYGQQVFADLYNAKTSWIRDMLRAVARVSGYQTLATNAKCGSFLVDKGPSSPSSSLPSLSSVQKRSLLHSHTGTLATIRSDRDVHGNGSAAIGAQDEEAVTHRRLMMYGRNVSGHDFDITLMPADNFFLHSSDAIMLSSAVLGIDPCALKGQGPWLSSKKLKVAIIDREESRKLENIDEVKRSLAAYSFIEKVSTFSHLGEKSLVEQAKIMYEADVVIAAHGAALANIAFMRPCSVVVEAIPWLYSMEGYFAGLSKHVDVLHYLIDNGPANSIMMNSTTIASCSSLIQYDFSHFFDTNLYTAKEIKRNFMRVCKDPNDKQRGVHCRICFRNVDFIRFDLKLLEAILNQAYDDRVECLQEHPFLHEES